MDNSTADKIRISAKPDIYMKYAYTLPEKCFEKSSYSIQKSVSIEYHTLNLIRRLIHLVPKA
jgi:hypothetical protein